MENLSAMNRYVALNAEILKQRGGRPLHLDIHAPENQGHEILRTQHQDVMLESATTSFQIHWQIPPARATRAYNASVIASGPLLAASVNSPFLFGKNLWAETRIPVFEQAVEVGGFEAGAHGPMRRVSFGTGYARHSVMECFQENLEHFPVLLPVHFESALEKLEHLRLHNGTLWRWNRPLIGFSDHKPHLRIEQRVVPAGPTIEDAVANAALFYGLAQALCDLPQAPETQLGFPQARENFYRCAQQGLDAHCVWLDGNKHPVQALLLKTILPMARQGLVSLGIDEAEIAHYLGIIEQRVAKRQTGAAWQRAFIARYGHDMQALLAAYLDRQDSGKPVHTWSV
jgi:gamma-glutamyl:cysteine ligase YbdK (ATP-grasp superfamily)